MTTTQSALLLPQVQAVLERLHTLADSRDHALSQEVRDRPSWTSLTAAERASQLKEVLMPVSRSSGRFLYGVARSTAARQIVEFGSSFGVSTLYFAAAVRDNGAGRVIGSELEPGKVLKVQEHLAEAGLAEFVEVRAGDARETLQDIAGPIDLLFLDGWKELYLDLLHLLSPRLRPGAIVLADDTHLFPEALSEYLGFVRDPANGFASVDLPLDDGIEYSIKL